MPEEKEKEREEGKEGKEGEEGKGHRRSESGRACSCRGSPCCRR